ncbi:alpha/beta-hydrolase [Penicillium malachiteum]|uniref:alpha/beta-hydrolase n=1 Tax=Penicillium malachiteum TaxID=1324776 RepID=UPI002548C880|nr:alpha/beta-hydrolase [Penicillium malachiteum]KAJ5728775.1 alpha/beta-hydrolase [Penicillium malachiteum]
MTVSHNLQSSATDIGDVPVEVVLPTHTNPSYEQRIIGKASLINGIEEFRGIPYGIVPARWQHSSLRDRVPDDILYATKNGPRCPQEQEPNNSEYFQSHLDFPDDVAESEFDCLNLFITRPSASALDAVGIDPKLAKLPVYAYLHGGAYSFGAGTDPMWDPARLVKRSVEVGTPILAATINYRLGIFGFGAASELIQVQPDGQLKGCNFGLADQRVALRWVKRNIAAFGGNSNQITVGGQSAGGSSSHALILESVFGKREPLAQRAIAQSGALGVVGPVSMKVANERWAIFCDKIGAPDSDSSARLKFMTDVPAEDLVKTFHELNWLISPLVVDGLTILEKSNGRWDIRLDGNEEPVTDAPINDSEVISVLIGDTDLEGRMHFDSVSRITTFNQIEEKLANKSPVEFLDEFYQVYGLHQNMSTADIQKQLFHFLSDFQFGYPVQLAREELMQFGHSKKRQASDPTARPTLVQSYRVNFGNPFPGLNFQQPHHCVDLIYIYDCFEEALNAVDESLPAEVVKNRVLVRRMQDDWIRFIAAPLDTTQNESATNYNADRTTSIVNIKLDPEWCARQKRFDLLSRYRHVASQVMGELIRVEH